MRLFIRFLLAPFPRGDGADNCLAAGMNVDMLHRDLLLPFAAVTLEGTVNLTCPSGLRWLTGADNRVE